MPCGPPGSLTSSFTSSSAGVGLAGNSASSSTAGPLHHYAPYHHVHHVADGGAGGGAAPLCGTSSTLVNSSSSSGIICGSSNSPSPYSSSSSPHHYSGHTSVAVAAAAAAAAAAAYHHHHHHHFASSGSAYHPYSYNYSSNGNSSNSTAGSAVTNGHHPTSSACSTAYAHYPAPSSSPSALELTRRKMISRSSPVSTSWRSNSPSPWEMEGEALLALPTLTGFKQEAPSPPNGEHGRVGTNPSPPQSTERASSEGRTVTHLTGHGGDQSSYSHPFQHMLHQHSGGWSGQDNGTGGSGTVGGGAGPITGGVGTGSASSLTSSSSNEGMSSSGGIHQQGGSGSAVVGASNYHGEKYKYDRLNETDANADNRLDPNQQFQYVLAAATSIATKVNEESLTYLNQGQPYEIKMKKLGDLSNFRGKLLRSVVRLCFHERRLQYMEREQIAAWRMSRPGDRIVEIDVPLSYGIYEVVQDNSNLNVVEFAWDPTKEVGVYIKVNCISTEFTPKKHGGEKGVPFRIQVETYSHGDGDGTPKRLHVAGCQIKVFKLKGADRKHKQDREKIYKRPMVEQEKYQPSCECTILAEIPLELVYTSAIVPVGTATSNGSTSVNQAPQQTVVATTVVTPPAVLATRTYSPTELHKSQSFTSDGCPSESPLGHETDNVESPTSMIGSGNSAVYQYYLQPLSAEASAQQTAQWLQTNRFSSQARTFSRFAGADILRLTRDDLIQICGVADGIRLYNALHAKPLAPRLTLYLTQDQSQVFHAIFLENLSCVEIANKLAGLVQLSSQHILDVYIEGPCGIHVHVTDEVVQNMKDESMFTVELLPDQTSERYRLLLKSTSPH
ncbi:transcription factor CP2-like isoform X5 [Daphnia pulex]|uniref:transcription factor CP2-like isoform X5 n=1 Tax=Daphnia pulex TaxID=6669 RepID=UPI001EE0E196|nr:transcription factor CP2-like isoform X5 [Daphnia pulex]